MKLSTKSVSILIFAVLFTQGLSAQENIGVHPDFELVESVPIETVLDNPDIRNTYEVWLEMINGAKRTLDIEQFYISNQTGEPLEDIIAAIERAADRGVAVRIIADAKFYKTYPEMIERLRRNQNIEARLIDFGKIAGGIQHAKYFIVDGGSIFFGSQNFDWRALKHIHELGVRIRNADAVRIYLDNFNLDWKLAEPTEAKPTAALVPRTYSVPLRSVFDGDTISYTPTYSPIGWIVDSTLWDEPNIIRLIDGARKEVSLQFLGYDTRTRGGSDYLVLDNALRRAAARNAKVRLLIADWEKGTPSERSLNELANVPNIEVKFSSIPDWSGGYVSFARVEHCKFVVVDSEMFWLGTSNAERSYFYTSRNLGVVVRNTKLGSLLQRIFSTSWNGPYVERVDPDKQYTRREHGEKQ